MPPLEQHDDDKPIGRLLSRREMLALLGGAASVAVLGGCTLEQLLSGSATSIATPAVSSASAVSVVPSCVVRPALTEGPYFVDEMLNRSDIRVEPSDGSVKEGVRLHLVFRVFDVSTNACTPLQGAQIDVWHCDALGIYSDVEDPGFNTSGQKWLRGYQITDTNGTAEFITIYPGWYSSRTVHSHFKIRTDPGSETGYEFTSQLFFDEAVTDQVHARQPYASKGYRDTLNADDNIFQSSEGLLTLEVAAEQDGYAATFDIGLDTSQPSSDSSLPGGPSGGGAPPGGIPPGGSPPPR